MLTAYDLTGEFFHQTTGDVNTLKQLARQLPPNPVIINIGACFGTSALAMLEERRDAFIFSVDVLPSPAETENLHRAGLFELNRLVRCLGRSQDIGRYWPGPADMVYIDGSHAYKDVIADINVWLPRIKPGGVILFHDYNKGNCPGVKPAVDGRMWEYPLILFEDSMIAFQL
jgi:predicted O-methyltransferase YrrM